MVIKYVNWNLQTHASTCYKTLNKLNPHQANNESIHMKLSIYIHIRFYMNIYITTFIHLKKQEIHTYSVVLMCYKRNQSKKKKICEAQTLSPNTNAKIACNE